MPFAKKSSPNCSASSPIPITRDAYRTGESPEISPGIIGPGQCQTCSEVNVEPWTLKIFIPAGIFRPVAVLISPPLAFLTVTRCGSMRSIWIG